MSFWCFARLRQHFSSAKPISGIFLRIDPLSSVPTQHLITPIPHPGRDNGNVKPFGFHSVVHDTANIGLVVEDILDGHS